MTINPRIIFAIQKALFHFTNLQVTLKKISTSGVMYHSTKCYTPHCHMLYSNLGKLQSPGIWLPVLPLMVPSPFNPFRHPVPCFWPKVFVVSTLHWPKQEYCPSPSPSSITLITAPCEHLVLTELPPVIKYFNNVIPTLQRTGPDLVAHGIPIITEAMARDLNKDYNPLPFPPSPHPQILRDLLSRAVALEADLRKEEVCGTASFAFQPKG